jgi:NADPH:quinone reductase-like Zn-dependent oxidoreductase
MVLPNFVDWESSTLQTDKPRNFNMTSNRSQMRAYQLDRLGSLDGLVLAERDIPSPGIGEVLVRVRASSLNFRDMMILTGAYPMPVPPGRVPLSDGAGEVVEVGAGLKRFKVGDRVINSFFPNFFGGSFNAMPEQWVIDHDGWLTEYKAVSAEALVPMPEYLTFEEAATLPCVAVTAWSALSGVRAGDTVLTQGTGGVSLFALQLAKVLGTRVITTTTHPESTARLRELGSDEVIDVRDSAVWGDQVRALTGGRGVDRVVEVGGPGTLAQSTRAVAYGGQVSMVGALAAADGGMDFMSMFLSQARFQPIATGSRRDLQDLCRVMQQHLVRPVIDSVFSFDDAKSAWSHYAGRKVTGKVVIRH